MLFLLNLLRIASQNIICFICQMAGQILYSVNPWFSHHVSMTYRGGKHFAWCSETFDASKASATSSLAAVAPSSDPIVLYHTLHKDCKMEERHSALIKGYKRTFKRLAKEWFANNEISKDQYDEIIFTCNEQSWNTWKPCLYVIPRKPIEDAGRLIAVPKKDRAGLGPEYQIHELMSGEFDIVEFLP